MRKLAVLFLVAFLGLTSCSNSNKGPLEAGGFRIPDDAGVVTDSTLSRIQLDKKRNYDIADNVESFGARSHAVQSLLSWEGKYVQLGLDSHRKVRWIAGIGTVLKTTPSVVYYTAVVDHADLGKHRVFFDDGTVLTVASGLAIPLKGTEVVCTLDPHSGLVTKLTAG